VSGAQGLTSEFMHECHTPSIPRMVAGSDFQVPGPHQRWIAFSQLLSRALSLTVPALLSKEIAMNTTLPAHSLARRPIISWDVCIEACKHTAKRVSGGRSKGPTRRKHSHTRRGSWGVPRKDPTKWPKSQSLKPADGWCTPQRVITGLERG